MNTIEKQYTAIMGYIESKFPQEYARIIPEDLTARLIAVATLNHRTVTPTRIDKAIEDIVRCRTEFFEVNQASFDLRIDVLNEIMNQYVVTDSLGSCVKSFIYNHLLAHGKPTNAQD